MKLKLFFIIWITFLIAVALSSLLYSELLKRERIRSLDAQLESLSSLLAKADIVGENIVDLKEADELIQDVIGGYRLGLVIVLKNNSGRVLYRNHNAARLGLNAPIDPAWQFIEYGNNLIRVFSRREPGKPTVLQMGLVVNHSLLTLQIFGPWFGFFVALLMLGSALIAFGLTSFLLRPLRLLARDLSDLTQHYDPNQSLASRLPKNLQPSETSFLGRFDELVALVRSLQSFLRHHDSAFRTTMAHSAQLAHEIKTPLTVIRNEVVRLQPEGGPKAQEAVRRVTNEIDQLAEFVDRYLRWGENINRPLSKTDIFAIHIEKYLPELLDRLQSITKGRLKLGNLSPLMIFANAQDLEHVLMNLVQNALKYSPDDKEVVVQVEGRTLSVIDRGPGLPAQVIERIGQPFNPGLMRKQGAGLGLSLVHLICKKYDWVLRFNSSPYGTEISIQFPVVEETEELT